jgi:hypothetical protein
MQVQKGFIHRCGAALPLVLLLVVAGCAGEEGGVSIASQHEELTGCHGQASSKIPASGDYYLTTFGYSSSDDGQMSCGQWTNGGSWYYAASRQRYGCGARVQIEANGNCVIAETDDYGPDVCVEEAAGVPVMDVSPLVAKHLFGVSSAGWSDSLPVHVSVVSSSTPLGPTACDSAQSECVAGGLYCGGDKVTGDPDTLYRCNGDGSATRVFECSHGCAVRPGRNDTCRCFPNSYYCGGDMVVGDPDNLYRCSSSGIGFTLVKRCARGCAIHTGANDACR